MSPNYLNWKEWDYVQYDIETHDPLLLEVGYSCLRNQGFVLGVAISGQPGTPSEYYNLGHPGCSQKLANENRAYLKEITESRIPKLGARLKYDVIWMTIKEKMKFAGLLYDVQIAEPLLWEYDKSFSLNSLAIKYGIGTKQYDEPYQWLIANWRSDWGPIITAPAQAVGHLAKVPYEYVRPYALGDVDLPGKIFEKQKVLLEEQGLWDLFIMETELQYSTIRAEITGVKVNKERLINVGMEIADKRYELKKTIENKFGYDVDPKSPKDTKFIMDTLGLEYPRKPPTENMIKKAKAAGVEPVGNPRLDKKVLGMYKDKVPLIKDILDYRHFSQLLSLYINPYQKFIYNGRIYGQFNQLGADDSGTVSGRYSGKMPNEQQVTAIDEILTDEDEEKALAGAIIRDLFEPDDGFDWILSQDGSQIEYRIMAHYAKGVGSDQIRERYLKDKHTDYHQELGNMVGMPDKKDRKIVKSLNFGVLYGMGPAKMAMENNWTEEYSYRVTALYHSKVPFARTTMNWVSNTAIENGMIRTFLRRRARMLYFKEDSDVFSVSPIQHPGWKPYKAYVMLNRLIQGTAADWMKQTMVNAEKAGIFDSLPLHITLHDELVNSMRNTKEHHEAALELNHIMETALTLRVPILAEAKVGTTWGQAKKYDLVKKEFKE